MRYLHLIVFIVAYQISSTNSRRLGSRHKRQYGSNLYLPESYIIPDGDDSPENDQWGPWGSPSECSRSCGGGVAYQTRECLNVSPDGRPQCRGGSRKYFSCNIQDCPDGEADFRKQQCSEFNDTPFEGHRYQWVPYTKAPNPCELNCMPIGERFYYRHKAKVIDGTRCTDESFDVCVDGTCQAVGCDMMLGSNAKEDKCRTCQGDGSGCKTVTGLLDMKDLQVGYNDLLLIPAGATNVVINERGPSNNYLAIRNLTGFYHLNGNYRIDFPRVMHFSGTDWHYERRPQGFAAPDKLTCLGPTSEPVYLVLLSQDRNEGVNYEYSVASKLAPIDETDSYAWTYTPFSACSVSCGGGIQYRNVTCNSRSTMRQVDSGLCDAGAMPTESQRCAQEPCPPLWTEGPWGNCSMPCGSEGKQLRDVNCERISTEGTPETLEDSVCLEQVGNKPATEQECNRGTVCPEWYVGKWTPCDKLCGEGEQTRNVVCYRKENGRITVLDDSACVTEKPTTKESCMLRPCEGVDYIASSWSGCEECGATMETRSVYCASKSGTVYDKKFCANREMPDTKRECKSDPCEFQWYTSQWSKCSAVCGKGVQTRNVVCAVFDGQSLKRADDDYKCDAATRPDKERECDGPDECPGQWFSGPWTGCSKECGGGFKSRKVLCIANGTVVAETNCKVDTIELSTESCNAHDCTDDEIIPVDTTSTPLEEDDYDDEEWCDEEEEEVSEMPDGVIMITEDTSLVDGVDWDSTHLTTESSLETDEMMLSDSTGFESGATDSDTSTGTSVPDGSGAEWEDIEIIEASGDDEGASIEAESTKVTSSSSSTDAISDGSSIEVLSSLKVTDTSTELPTGTSDVSTADSSATSVGGTQSSTSATSTAESSDDTSEDTRSSKEPSSVDLPTVSTDMSSESDTSSSVSSAASTTSSDTTESSSSTESSLSTDSTIDSSTVQSSSVSSDDSMEIEEEISETSTLSSIEDLSSTHQSEVESSTDSSTDDADSTTMEDSSTDSSLSVDVTTSTLSSSSGSSEMITTTASSEMTTGAESTSSTLSAEVSATQETVSSEEPSSTEAGTKSALESTTTDSTLVDDSSTGASSTVDSDSSTESSSSVDSSTVDIWTSEATDEMDETSTPYTLVSVISKEQKPRKCKPRPKTPKCAKSEFGCCPDEKTKASGPFDEGCPVPKTCKDTKHGCCPDNVSPAKGANNKGCPKSDCAETLFGCCPDKITPAQGNDFEECPVETTTVGGCAASKLGCCADGVTEVEKGCPTVKEPLQPEETTVKVEVGCAASAHGCCSDNVTEATGPDGAGCATCVTEPYGCCPDGKTPAHGPHREGCCIDTPYGCCPDNINPARGPNLEGCGCEYSPYGCCPDNTTSARGYHNEGCGCQYSEFGCCPDKVTAAHGEKFAGCPCHAFQFGCCPDGVTTASGPHSHGCHCSYSEFKCCSDNQTPAQGLNFEGCTCATSKYGCCPDGVSEAQGTKFEGCEVVPESAQKACMLKKDMGTCHNFTVKYFFDVEYGGCGRFWYGGCGGNKNRFDSAEECKDVCEMPEGKDKCQLPKIAGPCTGYYPMWYYDADRNTCAQFTYGGCLGNANRFETIEECKASCLVDDSLPPCDQPKESGPCNGTFERWYFDKERDHCEPFLYGGCRGNKNNYPTESSCNYHCKKPGVHKPSCTLPMDAGSCDGKLARWHFAREDNKCMPFYYTGCGGNDNQHISLEQCEEQCPPKVEKDDCFLPAEVGECHNYTAHWYFDTKDSRCRQFYYGGCGGNGNNFADEQLCINRCIHGGQKQPDPLPQEPDVHGFDPRSCYLDMDSGDRQCETRERRYFYDRSASTCQEFTFTGCGGNENNFASFEECDNACGQQEDPCHLRPAYGQCSENETRWYFNPRSQLCDTFTFSGCHGNRNNFHTQGECEQRCLPESVHVPAPPVATTDCDEPYDYGTGNEATLVWIYDKERGYCMQNYYSGEGGNNNRFSSQEQCDRQCGQFRGVDVCLDAKDSGRCTEHEPRFYYDSRTHTCLPFNYSGCEGNGNRFISTEECQATCVDKQVDNEVDPCEVTNEECRNLNCPYGVARSYDPTNDCEKCSCVDPCSEVHCESGTECSIELQSGHQDGVTFIGICVSTTKPGYCPRLANATSCHDSCRRDTDCRNDFKCCQAGCATICVQPVLDVPSAPVGPPTVPAPPVLETVPAEELDIKSEEGGTATLRCFATGFPPPSIRWKKGEVVLNTNQGRFVLTSNGDLQIVQLHRTDSGTYVCIADNGIGEPVLREVSLQVNDPVPRDAYIAGEANETQVVELNQPTMLRCPAGGYPKPIVTWWRETFMMPVKLINRDYSLQFTRVRLSDLGPYVCQAYSGAGKGVSRTVLLKAYGPVLDPVDDKYLRYIVEKRPPVPSYTPRPYPTPPTPTSHIYIPPLTPAIVHTPAPEYAPRVPVTVHQELPYGREYTPNSNITIRCIVDGYPQPAVNWYKDGHMMEPSARVHLLSDNTLHISSAVPADSGAYRCHAQNEHSEAFEENVIRVEGVYVPESCTDNPFLAKCALIVQARFCNHKYYAKFCCKSCTLAGQLRH